MLNFLKELPNIGLYFSIWVIFAYWLHKNKHRLATLVITIGIVLFLISATNYVPKKLIASIESAYDPIDLNHINRSETYYIHVLGAGASRDARLPASMNLNQETLIRLIEGIRIYNYLNQAVLVTSAASTNEPISQAEISKKAAISLGVAKEDIEMLETPTSTLEEALAFKNEYGTDKNIILVTSAVHMPRAVEIFRDQGLKVIPAPTGYLYKEDETSYNGITLPSIRSLELMNIYQVTVLKSWYYKMFKTE